MFLLMILHFAIFFDEKKLILKFENVKSNILIVYMDILLFLFDGLVLGTFYRQ